MGYGQVISKNFSAGGTMGGDLTLEGDLVVQGDGSGNYDEIVNGNLAISSTNKLVLGGDGSDSYIQESAADALDLYAGGVQMLQLLEGASDYVWIPVDATKFAIGAATLPLGGVTGRAISALGKAGKAARAAKANPFKAAVKKKSAPKRKTARKNPFRPNPFQK